MLAMELLLDPQTLVCVDTGAAALGVLHAFSKAKLELKLLIAGFAAGAAALYAGVFEESENRSLSPELAEG